MTFEEAIQAKKEIGDITIIEDTEYKVFVVPYDYNDIGDYIAGYLKTEDVDDAFAKLYSKNSKFKVYGLYQYRTSFLKKELKG